MSAHITNKHSNTNYSLLCLKFLSESNLFIKMFPIFQGSLRSSSEAEMSAALLESFYIIQGSQLLASNEGKQIHTHPPSPHQEAMSHSLATITQISPLTQNTSLGHSMCPGGQVEWNNRNSLLLSSRHVGV